MSENQELSTFLKKKNFKSRNYNEKLESLKMNVFVEVHFLFYFNFY